MNDATQIIHECNETLIAIDQSTLGNLKWQRDSVTFKIVNLITSARDFLLRPRDLDAPRELSHAAKRITKLETALKTIIDAPCDANGQILVSACSCCLHDRMIARAALDGVE
jgi:hypothetical protein